MSEELLFAVDENGTTTTPVTRAEAHARGIWHRTAHVWVVLPDMNGGSLLFQRRSAEKDVAPGLLDVSVGGHLAPGEDAREAALRELEEELGVTAPSESLVPLGVRQTAGQFPTAIDREFQTIFGVALTGDVSRIQPQVEEVSAVVPVPVPGGLALLSESVDSLTVDAYPATDDGVGSATAHTITRADFIPIRDGYYYRAFVMALRWLNGEDHLVV